MKRISEIKDLLSKVYFYTDEKDYVIAFLEDIGVKGARSLVVYQEARDQVTTSRVLINPRRFYEECIGHEIGEIFTIDTATSIAIEDYLYQVQQLKKKEKDSQEQIDSDKGNLYALLMISMCVDASVNDIIKSTEKDNPALAEEIRSALKRAIAD